LFKPSENDSVTAADVVNKLGEKSLARLISKYGEERMAEKIAHGICYFRSAHGPIMTTKQLADIIGTTMSE
jgi:16S rRNA (cytosine1402-N4)-methyltransferase